MLNEDGSTSGEAISQTRSSNENSRYVMYLQLSGKSFDGLQVEISSRFTKTSEADRCLLQEYQIEKVYDADSGKDIGRDVINELLEITNDGMLNIKRFD